MSGQYSPPIVIITADKGGGKTTFIKALAKLLDQKSISHTGFYAEGNWEEGERSSFQLVLLPGKETIPLCDRVTEQWPQVGAFRFNPPAVSKGVERITNPSNNTIVLIDEVGKLELKGEIWGQALTQLIERNKNPLIITVRREFVVEVISHWQLSTAVVVDAKMSTPDDVVRAL